ncbi:hypothetical protein D3C85_1073210 [compost metagenome]
MQDPNGIVYPCISTPEFSDQWIGAGGFIDQNDEAISTEMELSSDYSQSVIKKSQWQAERDKQKGGEWKRHRGGKCPVPAGTKASTRHRDGEVVDVHFQTHQYGTHKAVMDCVWKHDGGKDDIMAYKVISQPQAEEVEVDKFCMGYKCEATAKNIDHSKECLLEAEMSYTGFKIDQIDGPIKWRDTVNELDAYIEEFTRERESLINRLALEGFALLPAMTPVMGVADVDMGDWRNWQKGDIVEVILENDADLPVGRTYAVKEIESPDYGYGMPVCVWSGNDDGVYHWPEDSGNNERLVFKFIRRP